MRENRSVLTDCRVGRFVPDAAFQHPATVDADRFRHRLILRLIDNTLKDTFSWETTYDSHLWWIEQLFAAFQQNPVSSHLKLQLQIAVRVLDYLILKIEDPLVPWHGECHSITSVAPKPRQQMSLKEWARAKVLQSCPDIASIASLPVPALVKHYLLFNKKRNAQRLQSLEKSRKPSAFTVYRNKYAEEGKIYPSLSLAVDYPTARPDLRRRDLPR